MTANDGTVRFYFATCQAGMERLVKDEVLAAFPRLRFAFSRPGFMTFKEEREGSNAIASWRGVFARLWGEVLGQAKDHDALAALLAAIPEGSSIAAFDRDERASGDEPGDFSRDARISRILGDFPPCDPGPAPSCGDCVYDLVWVGDFHVFLARHIHEKGTLDAPGNAFDAPVPVYAPSRAWLKIEEAIARFSPATRSGLPVLELGSAPGGATSAMLARGLAVTGVDPQRLDERVLAMPGLRFIRKQARYLLAEDLDRVDPEWLVLDMNIPPRDALAELAHVMGLLRKSLGRANALRHGFFTFKLNDLAFAKEIPAYLSRLEDLGFTDLTPLQLTSNRREFFVWAGGFGGARR